MDIVRRKLILVTISGPLVHEFLLSCATSLNKVVTYLLTYWEVKDLSNKNIVVIYLQSIEERLKAINTASAETQRYCMETTMS